MKKYLLSNRVRNAILLAILLQSVIFGIGLLVTGTFSGTVNRPYKVMESQVSEKNSLLLPLVNKNYTSFCERYVAILSWIALLSLKMKILNCGFFSESITFFIRYPRLHKQFAKSNDLTMRIFSSVTIISYLPFFILAHHPHGAVRRSVCTLVTSFITGKGELNMHHMYLLTSVDGCVISQQQISLLYIHSLFILEFTRF